MPGRYIHNTRLVYLLLIGSLSLAGCSFTRYQDGGPRTEVNVANIPDAVPRVEPRSANGNPDSYTVLGHTYHVMQSSKGYVERGIASWYGTKFHGRTTSSGEVYSMYKMTAAHKTLPIPSYVQVTNLENGRKIVVRVNDRGPFHPNRIIDLSYVAAKKLGIAGNGTGLVEVRSIDPRNWQPERSEPAPVQASYRPPVKPENTLYIQAGAFASRYNAEQFKKKLDVLLPKQTVQMAYLNSDKLYRVRVGPLPNVDEADKVAQTISNNGYPEPHVVIE
ncbi:MAG: septal ring lytic transglycosylase RlpA family protein [Gammaproteobacteria bacterium]|nr:septal ring lytic transglycosylase RlpA family protein [Gammaproteobacteria bacterium]